MTDAPILAQLEAIADAKLSDRGWSKARCPAHDDDSPSFGWTVHDGGSVGLKCQAGCRNEDIVVALGCEMKDLFVPKDKPVVRVLRERKPAAQGDRSFDAAYADGSKAGTHRRTDDGDGDKRIWWEPKGIRTNDLQPFGAWDLPADGPVVVVEGERATAAVRTGGINAVGTYGSTYKPTAAALDALAGRDVVLWPDNDRVGRQHMDDMAERVRPIVASVRIVTVPADASDKWDAADADADTIRALVERAGEPPVAETKATSRDVAQAGAFMLREFPPVRWRTHELLPAEGFATIVGTDKEGKSLLALQASLCIAAGQPLLGRNCQVGTVLLIEEEGSAQAFQERLQTQAAAMGLLSELDRLPLHVSIRQRWRLDTEDEVREIEAAANEVGADVIFIGPLSQLAGIDENANKDMNAVTRRLLDMLARRGGLLVLSHHRRKAGEDQPRTVREFFDSTRGGNALMAAVDAAVGVRRDPEATEGSIFVMLRDGPAQRIHITFDAGQLLVHPTDAPPDRKADLGIVEAIVVEAGDWVDRTYVSAKAGVSRNTVAERLEVLVADGRLEPRDGPRNARQYRHRDLSNDPLTGLDRSAEVTPVSRPPFRGAAGDRSELSVTGAER